MFFFFLRDPYVFFGGLNKTQKGVYLDFMPIGWNKEMPEFFLLGVLMFVTTVFFLKAVNFGSGKKKE